MNKERFRDLVINRDFSGSVITDELADLIGQFPYFQSARILYTKALFDQQHFKYNDQLKIAAAYAGDRKILHQFILEPRSAPVETLLSKEVITNDEPADFTPGENIYTHEMASDLIIKSGEATFEKLSDEHNAEVTEDFEVPVISITETNEKAGLPAQSEELIIENRIEEQALQAEEPKPSAMEIIEMRLTELIKNKQKETVQSAEEQITSEPILHTAPPASDNEPLEQIIINDTGEESIQEDPSLIVHDLSPLKEEELLQSTEIKSEPVKITHEPVAVANDASFLESRHSFTDWLHRYEFVKKEAPLNENRLVLNKEPVTPSEVSSFNRTPEKKEKIPTNDLIERFINAEPRIDATKAKFYSPVNMAKKSIVDQDELVSETLALIYFEQGNLAKAIQTLEKLSLKFPEKSRYFADQIQVLKNKQPT